MTYIADTVTLAGTQTLLNKTIDSAVFSGTQTGNFTTTGNITIDSAGDAEFYVDSAAGNLAEVGFRDAGVDRWVLRNQTTDAFTIDRYVSGSFQDRVLSVANSTGNVTIANDLIVTGGDIDIDSAGTAQFILDKGSSGNACGLICRTGGAERWYLSFSNTTAESGSNAGSNLEFYSYTDAGAFLATPFSITRANSYVNLPGVYAETTASAANVFVASDGSLQRSTSSLRYKVDIEDMAYGLKDVLALRPVTYAPKPNGENDDELDNRYGGLIAEEVDAAGLKEFVGYNDEGQPDSLHYGHMVALCIKAIQELKAEVDQLRKQINGSI